MEKSFKVGRNVEGKIMATRNSITHNYKYGSVASLSLPHFIRLTPQNLEEKREKNLYYSCDIKYSKDHKCVENKLFYIDYEEEEEKEH